MPVIDFSENLAFELITRVCVSLKQVDLCKKVLKVYRYVVTDMTLDEATWLAFDKNLHFAALL